MSEKKTNCETCISQDVCRYLVVVQNAIEHAKEVAMDEIKEERMSSVITNISVIYDCQYYKKESELGAYNHNQYGMSDSPTTKSNNSVIIGIGAK